MRGLKAATMPLSMDGTSGLPPSSNAMTASLLLAAPSLASFPLPVAAVETAAEDAACCCACACAGLPASTPKEKPLVLFLPPFLPRVACANRGGTKPRQLVTDTMPCCLMRGTPYSSMIDHIPGHRNHAPHSPAPRPSRHPLMPPASRACPARPRRQPRPCPRPRPLPPPSHWQTAPVRTAWGTWLAQAAAQHPAVATAHSQTGGRQSAPAGYGVGRSRQRWFNMICWLSTPPQGIPARKRQLPMCSSSIRRNTAAWRPPGTPPFHRTCSVAFMKQVLPVFTKPRGCSSDCDSACSPRRLLHANSWSAAVGDSS